TVFALGGGAGPASAGASSNQPLKLKADGVHSCETIDAGSLKRRARDGNVRAQFMLAKLFQHGLCVERDQVAALGWFRRAADEGHVEATFQAAMQLINSADGEETAITYLHKAAEGGHLMAQHVLGLALLSPEATIASRHQGLYWLGSAASSGSGFTALSLGMLHERGLRGVPKNVCLAMDWYEAGVLIGDSDSKHHYKRLAAIVGDDC
ncbi:MAG: tetratricopeptide repeat protein, partial [Pseudomonadota bacterium]